MFSDSIIKGIPEFWLRIFKNVDILSDMLGVRFLFSLLAFLELYSNLMRHILKLCSFRLMEALVTGSTLVTNI